MCAASVLAQTEFEVIAIEGSAKVQRAAKKTWDNLAIGAKLHDNDIVETFFQAKLIARFGKSNVVIMGSNSKALFNIIEKDRGDGQKVLDASITLFSGGVFAKAVEAANISIYTSNAVGETSSGSLSAIVDPKSGETGFQLLGGSASTRNIAQKDGRALTAGQTTIVRPGKQPTAPLYITYRHVAVLKHFFGDRYITEELDMAGITPTDDRAGKGRMGMGDNLSADQGGMQNYGMYKSQFSLSRLYGIILDDEAKKTPSYHSISRPLSYVPGKFIVDAQFHFAITGLGLRPLIELTPSYHLPLFDAGLRLAFAQNSEGWTAGFSSLAGIFDKIDHLTIGKPADSTYVRLGLISNYSMSSGLIVDRFSFKNSYSVFNPLGLEGMYTWDLLKVKAFIADISQWTIGGLHITAEPSVYRFGIGYYWDANQYNAVEKSDNDRYLALPDTVPGKDSITSPVNVYELDFGILLLDNDDLRSELGAEFAQGIGNGRSIGIVARMPYINFSWRKFTLGAGLVLENGQLIASQFNSFYGSNRYRVWRRTKNDPLTFQTQNNILSPNKTSQSIELSFGLNPVLGSSVEAGYRLHMSDRNVLNPKIAGSDTLLAVRDFDLSIKASVDERIIPVLKILSLDIKQIHGGLYPAVGNYFASWGFSLGLFAASRPLFANMAITGGFDFYYLDMLNSSGQSNYQNNNIDAGDNVFDLFLGVEWGI